uniref:Uncharacterized protein n=1 Tax=Anguilla anguilla TaxID=7936 RepID=A0A0E9X7E6_ANGAN
MREGWLPFCFGCLVAEGLFARQPAGVTGTCSHFVSHSTLPIQPQALCAQTAATPGLSIFYELLLGAKQIIQLSVYGTTAAVKTNGSHAGSVLIRQQPPDSVPLPHVWQQVHAKQPQRGGLWPTASCIKEIHKAAHS